MKKIIISIVLIGWSVTIAAQDLYSAILQAIEQNSTTLQALKSQAEAQKLESRTGLAPANPEIEFGYLWGNPAAVGSRKDISISQSFDFPTVYVQRNKIAHLQNNSAEYAYRSQRMDLLLSAKNICIELIYYNALAVLYEQQVAYATQILQAYERMNEAGSAGQLEYNKALLNQADMENQLQLVHVERGRLLTELASLNGGEELSFATAQYAHIDLPEDFDQWYTQAEEQNPALQYLKAQTDLSQRQVKLTLSTSLPKITVGYMGEFSLGQNYQGLTVGLSIPLWENTNRMKHAKATALAAQQQADDVSTQYYQHLKNCYAQVKLLQANANRYEAAFSQNNNADLLFRAYQGGQLSLLNYLLEISYYADAYTKHLQTQRDLELTIAELTAYQL